MSRLLNSSYCAENIHIQKFGAHHAIIHSIKKLEIFCKNISLLKILHQSFTALRIEYYVSPIVIIRFNFNKVLNFNAIVLFNGPKTGDTVSETLHLTNEFSVKHHK